MMRKESTTPLIDLKAIDFWSGVPRGENVQPNFLSPGRRDTIGSQVYINGVSNLIHSSLQLFPFIQKTNKHLLGIGWSNSSRLVQWARSDWNWDPWGRIWARNSVSRVSRIPPFFLKLWYDCQNSDSESYWRKRLSTPNHTRFIQTGSGSL